MKSLSARRRHPAAAFVVLLLALLATGGLYEVFAPAGKAAAASSASASDIEAGKRLFDTGCSTCHGLGGEGTSSGPSLVGVGAAAVDFQVGTGRMPLQQQGPQAIRKPGIYTQQEIDQLAAYVASLGPGPAIPAANQYDPNAAGSNAVSAGGELFRANCAMCHNATGAGGALTEGKFAPNLDETDPKYIYEAMLTGPQNMPVFNDQVMPPAQKAQIIAYVRYATQHAPNPGGASIGRVGPVSEGLVLWVAGIGSLIIAACWIAARTTKARTSTKAGTR